MSLQTEVTSTSSKPSIFGIGTPLVFQVSPGVEKRYIHVEYIKTSGIGPLRNRRRRTFKFLRLAEIFANKTEARGCVGVKFTPPTPPPPRCSRIQTVQVDVAPI